MKHPHRRKLLTVVLIAALIGVGLFGLRTVRQIVYFSDPAHHFQQPEGWMTLGYVERSHRMAPRTLGPALGLSEAQAHRHTLAKIAEARGEPLPDFLSRVNAALGEADGR